MKSKQTKIFHIDGKEMRFDAQSFSTAFETYRRSSHLTVNALEDRLAAALGVSREAVHNWRFRNNGPSDYKLIQTMADVLSLKDWTLLMKEVQQEDGQAVSLTERQISAAKRIYDACIQFLSDFLNSDGFSSDRGPLQNAGSAAPGETVCKLMEKQLNQVFLILDQEYFDLHGCEIYDAFCEFAGEDLFALFDGRLGRARGLESSPSGDPAVLEDYDKAMRALNGIIEKYI